MHQMQVAVHKAARDVHQQEVSNLRTAIGSEVERSKQSNASAAEARFEITESKVESERARQEIMAVKQQHELQLEVRVVRSFCGGFLWWVGLAKIRISKSCEILTNFAENF